MALPPDEIMATLAADFACVAAGDKFLELIEKAPEIWREKPHQFHLWLARQLAGLTQRELAERAGVHQSLVARVERGRDVRLSTMARLYAALGYRTLIVPLKMPSSAFSPGLTQVDMSGKASATGSLTSR